MNGVDVRMESGAIRLERFGRGGYFIGDTVEVRVDKFNGLPEPKWLQGVVVEHDMAATISLDAPVDSMIVLAELPPSIKDGDKDVEIGEGRGMRIIVPYTDVTERVKLVSRSGCRMAATWDGTIKD